jgi:aquaporin PIP
VTAEYVGCFLFLFCTIGCVVFTQDGGITTARQLEVSLVFGGMITILVYGIGPISGGNLNPAVSLALCLSQKISPLRLVAYTAAQCLGAICGAGMVRIMTPALFDKVDGGANEISPNANPTESYGVEFGCTFLLVFTVMAATDGVRAKTTPHINAIAPLVIGLAVTVAHFVAIPVDNCSINPARSFGVSAISRNWNDHHVFWCVGGSAPPPLGHPPPPPLPPKPFLALSEPGCF